MSEVTARVMLTREDAKIIKDIVEEFFHKRDLSPEETRAFLNLCNAGDFGRPVPQTIWDTP